MEVQKYITERNLLFLLIGLLLITSVLDIYTAFTSPIFELAETNPIYVITGSKVPLLILTVLITIWIIKSLSKSISIIKIFLFTIATTYLIIGHSVGMYSNIAATNEYEINQTAVIERVNQYDTKAKFKSYSLVIGIAMLLPMLVSVLAFMIAMVFYNKRKPERERVIDDIYKLSIKLKSK